MKSAPRGRIPLQNGRGKCMGHIKRRTRRGRRWISCSKLAWGIARMHFAPVAEVCDAYKYKGCRWNPNQYDTDRQGKGKIKMQKRRITKGSCTTVMVNGQRRTKC